MSTDTEKNVAEKDAELTASRHPELALKDLPKMPPYSGTTEAETVNHPAHYGGDTTYETRKVIRAWELGFNLGNVAKYVSRAGRKPGTSYVEDLRKALFYLQDEIDSASSDY
jgi:hypothetical protein